MTNRHWSDAQMKAIFEWDMRRVEIQRMLKAHGTAAEKAKALGVRASSFGTLVTRARNRFIDNPGEPSSVYASIEADRLAKTLKSLECK